MGPFGHLFSFPLNELVRLEQRVHDLRPDGSFFVGSPDSDWGLCSVSRR